LFKRRFWKSNLRAKEGISLMMKCYFRISETLKRLRADKAGVVSFEYVIVAGCVMAAVATAFGTNAASGIGVALQNSISTIASYIIAAAA